MGCLWILSISMMSDNGNKWYYKQQYWIFQRKWYFLWFWSPSRRTCSMSYRVLQSLHHLELYALRPYMPMRSQLLSGNWSDYTSETAGMLISANQRLAHRVVVELGLWHRILLKTVFLSQNVWTADVLRRFYSFSLTDKSKPSQI